MNHADLINDYYDWLIGHVYDEDSNKYDKLLCFLFEEEFVYTLKMDVNRAADGEDLRYRFSKESSYTFPEIRLAMDRPCSWLEMLVALSLRCEESIMEDDAIGDRTGVWFWKMIVNLGLSSLTNARFSRTDAVYCLDRFTNHDYNFDGSGGGLFVIRNPRRDMRDTEIWYQLNWYLTQELKECGYL